MLTTLIYISYHNKNDDWIELLVAICTNGTLMTVLTLSIFFISPMTNTSYSILEFGILLDEKNNEDSKRIINKNK